MVRDSDGRPPRGPWQCTASVCVAGVHCWEISLGFADPWNVICLSALLICLVIFLSVFIACCLLIGFLFVLLYSAICSCVLVVLVKLSVLAN